ncbi:MAG: VWA domain-containing protein [Bryobacter sp.]|nr:VWA domain-containing protein [Bryobacter sp.]
MTSRRQFLLTGPALLGTAPILADQNQSPIQINVSEVIVPVTVADSTGKFVTDLKQSDFKIFDEGQEQKITYFNAEREQPVVVGFLLDLSNLNRLHWKIFQEAAQELVLALLPSEGPKRFSGYLVTYSTTAEVAVDTTDRSDVIYEKIGKLKPGGGAALYDALYLSCTNRKLVRGEPIEPRRIIVVVGDGHDSASKKSLDEVLEIAQRNLVTIFGMSTVAFGFSAAGEKNLTRLAEETGGRVVYPLQGLYKDVSGYLSTPSDEGNYALKVGTGQYAAELAKGMFNAVAAIQGEVTTQYIMRYVPDVTDSKKAFRSIRVEVPSLPGVEVRYRNGYYAQNP